MRRANLVLAGCGLAAAAAAAGGTQDTSVSKQLIAHRGASGYAPEHTLAAYRLAIEQGADFVEQDLAVTRDGVLVCIHDDGLQRTTDVEEVFPERSTIDPRTGRAEWLVADFTLEEIQRLDAGSWFDPRFAGERIPTWEDAVRLVAGEAGLYPELKSPPLYAARGLDMVALFVESLKRLGLDGRTRPATPLIVQSFDEGTIRRLARDLPGIPLVLLLGSRSGAASLTPERLSAIAGFAGGIGPAKELLLDAPERVRAAHAAGLTVTPYTFSAGDPGRFDDVTAEMRYFLYDLGVDGLFTDNPDRFPRALH